MGTFFADPVQEDFYLSNFRAKAEKMQEFPDKRIIDALTGSAMRHSEDKSKEISDLLKTMIMDQNRPSRHKLPLCYLVDSIVKNVNQPYTDLFEKGLVTWFCSAYDVVDDKSKVRANPHPINIFCRSLFSAFYIYGIFKQKSKVLDFEVGNVDRLKYDQTFILLVL